MAKLLSDNFSKRVVRSVEYTESEQGRRVIPGKDRVLGDGGPLWVFLKSLGSNLGYGRRAYVADVYANIGDEDPQAEDVAVLNSWEWENTASVQSGYTIISSGASCGDISGTSTLPLNQWYQVVDSVIYSNNYHFVISQRNDPTFWE